MRLKLQPQRLPQQPPGPPGQGPDTTGWRTNHQLHITKSGTTSSDHSKYNPSSCHLAYGTWSFSEWWHISFGILRIRQDISNAKYFRLKDCVNLYESLDAAHLLILIKPFITIWTANIWRNKVLLNLCRSHCGSLQSGWWFSEMATPYLITVKWPT